MFRMLGLTWVNMVTLINGHSSYCVNGGAVWRKLELGVNIEINMRCSKHALMRSNGWAASRSYSGWCTDLLLQKISGMLCQKQISREGTNNYIPQILWDVITCLCPWYPLLVESFSYIHMFYLRPSLLRTGNTYRTFEIYMYVYEICTRFHCLVAVIH